MVARCSCTSPNFFQPLLRGREPNLHADVRRQDAVDVPGLVHVRDAQEAPARIGIALDRVALVHGLQENEGHAKTPCVATSARVDPPRQRLP
eukprot:4145084-Pyramimonas_sp.AAC.1